jgi:hypothetical protein
MNKYDELLYKYVTKNEIRDKMLKPMAWGEYNAATDGHAIIIIPKSLCEDIYKDATLNIGVVIPQKNCEVVHNVQDIKKLFDNVEMVECFDELEETCKECHGEGDKYCYACEHSNTCDNCDGTGKAITEIPNGKFIPKPTHQIAFSESTFVYSYLNLLVETADKLGEQKITQIARGLLSANHFKVNDIDIILMPVRTQ